MPRRIQSHKRLLDEFFVVVVVTVGAVVCADWVGWTLAVVRGATVVVLWPAITAPAAASAAAPAMAPATTAP